MFNALLMVMLIGGLSACSFEPSAEDIAFSQQARVRIYVNWTGTRNQNGLDPEVDNTMIQMIDRAESTIDFAIMGFSRREMIEALVRAWERGVRLRFVGDARHMHSGTSGYLEMDRLNVPMISGNQYHIMHNKDFVIDDR